MGAIKLFLAINLYLKTDRCFRLKLPVLKELLVALRISKSKAISVLCNDKVSDFVKGYKNSLFGTFEQQALEAHM